MAATPRRTGAPVPRSPSARTAGSRAPKRASRAGSVAVRIRRFERIDMRYLSIAAAVILAGTVTLSADSSSTITGDYVEARTVEVFTGGCIMNMDGESGGREAVMAWRVNQGAYEGVCARRAQGRRHRRGRRQPRHARARRRGSEHGEVDCVRRRARDQRAARRARGVREIDVEGARSTPPRTCASRASRSSAAPKPSASRRATRG